MEEFEIFRQATMSKRCEAHAVALGQAVADGLIRLVDVDEIGARDFGNANDKADRGHVHATPDEEQAIEAERLDEEQMRDNTAPGEAERGDTDEEEDGEPNALYLLAGVGAGGIN
jgi:hypothetical protein